MQHWRTEVILCRLSDAGHFSRRARNLEQAREILRATPHPKLVLASEMLSDGRAYELIRPIERMGVSLLVSIALTDTCIWLPVVQRGRRTLGLRAMHQHFLEPEIYELLTEAQADLADHCSARTQSSRARRAGAPSRDDFPDDLAVSIDAIHRWFRPIVDRRL
jgi:hypothetical protein